MNESSLLWLLFIFKITESPFRNGIFVRVGYAVCFAFSVPVPLKRSERLIFINRRKSVKLHGRKVLRIYIHQVCKSGNRKTRVAYGNSISSLSLYEMSC